VVYRLVDGKAVITPVKIGVTDATHTQIVSGLADDDQVIVGPYKVLEDLKHNQRVYDDRTELPAKGPLASNPPKPS
jgi:HlyD family secretion protein